MCAGWYCIHCNVSISNTTLSVYAASDLSRIALIVYFIHDSFNYIPLIGTIFCMIKLIVYHVFPILPYLLQTTYCDLHLISFSSWNTFCFLMCNSGYQLNVASLYFPLLHWQWEKLTCDSSISIAYTIDFNCYLR